MEKKKIYKKWWFWAIVVFVAFILIIGSVDSDESTDTTTNSEIITEAKTNKTSETIDIELDVTPNVNSDNGSVLFGITTNLPEDTELMITVTNSDGYMAQDKAVILSNGKGYTSEFSNKGNALAGNYNVSVSMSLPRLQKDSVREIIGENGESISGKFVQKDDTTGANYVSGDFEFNF